MIVLVCGGRDYRDKDAVWKALYATQAKYPITVLVQGDCRTGADAYGRMWASANGVHYASVPALFHFYGKRGGPLRNRIMLSLKPDVVIAFPGGAGTASMVALATEAGIRVWQPIKNPATGE